jgi:transposase
VSEKVWRQNGDVLVTSYFLIDQTPTCRCPGVQLHRQCPSNSVVWQQRWPSLPEEWRALQHVRHVMTCEATCEARTCEQHVATCEATCEATCQACEARRLSLPEET